MSEEQLAAARDMAKELQEFVHWFADVTVMKKDESWAAYRAADIAGKAALARAKACGLIE